MGKGLCACLLSLSLAVPSLVESPLDKVAAYVNNKRAGINKPISKFECNDLSHLIVNASEEFGVPLDYFVSIISAESRFTNSIGDINFKNNFSTGYVQMRKETQIMVYYMMKAKKLFVSKPDNFMNDPELQFRMAAFYFNFCIEQAKGDVVKGVAKYNAGHNSSYRNRPYVRSVEGQHKDFDAL